MEAFEQVARLALEAESFAVSTGVKFPLRFKTKKKSHPERQTHGYEIDLLGARGDRLVLASVKSFFGSKGVQASSFRPGALDFPRYRLFLDSSFRRKLIRAACLRYGYSPEQVELRLYAGMFKSASDEAEIRRRLGRVRVGVGPVVVQGPAEIIKRLQDATKTKTYRNDAVVATVRLLRVAVP